MKRLMTPMQREYIHIPQISEWGSCFLFGNPQAPEGVLDVVKAHLQDLGKE